MRTIALVFTMFSTALMTGCATMAAYSPPNFEGAAEAPATQLADSLFKSDQAVLSNQDIDRILSSKVIPPSHARIAVVRIGGKQPWGRTWWSESVAQIEQKGSERLLTAFRGSPRVGRVMMLPSMLTPAQVTVPYLREAAARVQGDLLLVYRTFTQNYQQQHFFGGGDVHAYCTIEAVLLDTRSGIIIDTSVKTKSFNAPRNSKDLEFQETIARAEQEAIAEALGLAAEDLAQHLNAESPVPPTTRVAGQ